MYKQKNICRNTSNAVIGGVASGIAEYFDIDPILIRIAFIVFALFVGSGFLLYIILWIAIPDERSVWSDDKYSYGGNYKKKDDNQQAYDSYSQNDEDMNDDKMDRKEKREQIKQGNLTAGLILIAIGGFFLARNVLPDFDLSKYWPLILVAIGGVFISNALMTKK